MKCSYCDNEIEYFRLEIYIKRGIKYPKQQLLFRFCEYKCMFNFFKNVDEMIKVKTRRHT